MGEIRARHSSYIITDVFEIPRGLDDDLSYWDRKCFRLVNLGYMYDEEKGELRVPRGYNELRLKELFPDHIFKVDREANEYDDISIKLLYGPKDYRQEHILTFMIGKPPYQNISGYSQLYIDLDTGDGKTYCGIAASSYFKCNTLIFTPSVNNKIGKQWIESALKFTNCKKDEVLLVRGSEMCEDIIKGKYKDIKIFVIPRSTVSSFVRKYDDDWNMLDALIKTMRVGIKIVDEAHMDFSTLVKIECYSNVKRNYYMSASPSRSSIAEKGIYRKLFESIPKHGRDLKSKEQNHIIMLKVEFESTPSHKDLKAVKTRYGTSQAVYGDYLLDSAKEEFVDAYAFIVNYLMKIRKNGGKMLVPCISIRFIEEIEEITRELFPGYSTSIYAGKQTDEEKKKALEADIIFHTPKGLGTGADIANVQFIVNTITYSSDILAKQMSGRLREIKGCPTIYADIVNVAHKIAKKHWSERMKALASKAVGGSIKTLSVGTDDIISTYNDIDRGLHKTHENYMRDKEGYIIIPKRKI